MESIFFIVKKQDKNVNDVIYASVLQQIVSKNHSKCENNSTHTNVENVLLINANPRETKLLILNPNSCHGMDLMCELIWPVCDQAFVHYTPYSKMAATAVFFCFLPNQPWLPRSQARNSKEHFPLNDATRANMQVNIRILKLRSFLNKVYTFMSPLKCFTLMFHFFL